MSKRIIGIYLLFFFFSKHILIYFCTVFVLVTFVNFPVYFHSSAIRSVYLFIIIYCFLKHSLKKWEKRERCYLLQYIFSYFSWLFTKQEIWYLKSPVCFRFKLTHIFLKNLRSLRKGMWNRKNICSIKIERNN